jgi:AcrR family transcriptional regulator
MHQLRPAGDGARDPGASPSSRRGAQDRLLEAATELAARDGYAGLTVEKILAAAGVSRATFYQYFCNVDDCFWSAYRQHADLLTADVAAAVARAEHRQLAMLDALVDTAVSRPHVARLLMGEGLAAGPTGLRERDALIARVERATASPAALGCALDLPAATLIGATFRFLSMRLADAAPADGLAGEVREWAGAFARRSSRRSWSASFTPQLPVRMSRSAAPARPRRSAATPRQRILHATAAVIREKGYRAATVADIAAAAGVSRRRFYNEFAGKPDAFMAAYERGFRHVMAACIPAFFSAGAWPQRVWQGVLAFTNVVAREPSLAYLGFVECYAAGRALTRRIDDAQLAFTLFLEEGYRQRPQARSLSHASLTLTVTAIAETAHQAAREAAGMSLRRMQPLAVYIALTPFVGVEQAGAFVAHQLAASRPHTPAAA